MNDEDYNSAASDYAASSTEDYRSIGDESFSLDQRVRENPMVAVLGALGVGLVLGVLVRALATPSQPENRALSVLEDIQERLSDMADSGYSRVSSVAEDGADAVRKGVGHLGDLHLERSLGKLSRRLKDLFH